MHARSSSTASESLIEKRLVELESKLALAEDLLDQLNRTVYRQRAQIEFLARSLEALEAQQRPGGDVRSNPPLERPPHY